MNIWSRYTTVKATMSQKTPSIMRSRSVMLALNMVLRVGATRYHTRRITMRAMQVLGACVLMTVLSGGAMQAQTVPNVGQAFTLQFDHDGLNTTFYRLSIDGAVVGGDRLKAAVLTGTVGTIPVAGLTAGTHTLIVSAHNTSASTASAPLGVTPTLPPPTAPSNLRIVIQVTVAQDGTVTLLAMEAAVSPPTP